MCCWWRWLLLLLVTLFLYQLEQTRATELNDNTREYCQFEDFNVTCGRDEVILMEHARFGRMRIGTCVHNAFGYIGCATSVLDLVDTTCSGRRHCSFEIASLRKSVQPCPEDLVVYLEADYKCLKVVNESGHRCNRDTTKAVTEDFGFLSTGVIRPGGSGSERCPFHLNAKPGQHLNLTMYSFSYSSSSSSRGQTTTNIGGSSLGTTKGCSLYALITDGAEEHELSLCDASQRTTLLYKSGSSSLRVHFSTKGKGQVKDYNVLVKYAVNGCPDLVPPSNMWMERYEEKLIVKCNHSQETWYLTCEGTNWLGSVTNCSESQPLNGNTDHRVPHRFPFGLIIAITIGVVLGVTVGTVMLVTVFVYRRRRRRCRRPVKSNALLGDETSQENDENYARRLMQDYSSRSGSPGPRQCPHGSALHHHHYHNNPGDYSQMLELRCASAPITNSIYAERRPLASSQPSLPAMAGISLQKLGLGSASSFATFKPASGPYDKDNTYESRQALRTLPEHENRFIFDAEPDGPLSPDQQPDLVPNTHSENTAKDTELRGSVAPPETCSRHFSLYGQHKQQPAVNRVSNI